MTIQYRLFEWEDTDILINMVESVWQLSTMVGSKEEGLFFSKVYLYEVLKDCTEIHVAIENNQVIGMLALSLKTDKKLVVPYSIEKNSYTQRIKQYKKDCLSLLEKCKQTFDGEIVLFMVDPHYQGKGIGTHLFNYAKAIFKQKYIKHYFLYTDTSCQYTYYDHQGMKRIEAMKPNEEEQFEIYLYGGIIENGI